MIRSSFYDLSLSQRSFLDPISRPEDGSSKKMILGFPIKAIATDNFLF